MDSIESIIRLLGGVAALVVSVVVLISVRRFRSQPAGKTVGSSPAKLYSPVFLVIASMLAIVVCILFWRPIVNSLPLWAQLLALIFGTLFYFSGIGLILWGRQSLGKYHNVSSSQGVQLFADHELITSGPFAYVRHPMYLGFFLAVFGGLLLYRTWTMVLFLACSPVFVKRAWREEEALRSVFGETYKTYQRRVPAFIPRLFRQEQVQ